MEFGQDIPRCKKFTGYKPCLNNRNCLQEGCAEDNESNKAGVKILIISLEAMGNVLDNTPILKTIKRKFPISTIYWITMENAKMILINSKLIDKVFTWNDENRMLLRNINFDYLYNADKSVYACSFANEINATNKFGFIINTDGKIIPANDEAMYSYEMGLNDKLKFKENQKTGIEIIHEAFGIKYEGDEYDFSLDESEFEFIKHYKHEINYDRNLHYIGFNTGCSNLFPNKKMSVSQHIKIIKGLIKYDKIRILLLGGKEDEERNLEIFNSFNSNERKRIINTPATNGLRKGACYMYISDAVITGDSFGLHLAIALKKYVIVWFGLSCWMEIELFGRGVKIIPEGLDCSPCWKRECPYNLECINLIDLDNLQILVLNYIKNFPK